MDNELEKILSDAAHLEIENVLSDAVRERIQHQIYQELYESHDCKAAPDHGCSVCALLLDVGFLPDNFDDKSGD